MGHMIGRNTTKAQECNVQLLGPTENIELNFNPKMLPQQLELLVCKTIVLISPQVEGEAVEVEAIIGKSS
ncbi:unnamed protein product [Sphenostylis stenocarpa]|uniref:Uncharacterized protein n=1 Tax=Sphenostylis stenocarpa TaxID=92480 RepID=A0AA86VJS6_9FABA|nr:unnamed protein product [Sphenostylis stenocarpa]